MEDSISKKGPTSRSGEIHLELTSTRSYLQSALGVEDGPELSSTRPYLQSRLENPLGVQQLPDPTSNPREIHSSFNCRFARAVACGQRPFEAISLFALETICPTLFFFRPAFATPPAVFFVRPRHTACLRSRRWGSKWNPRALRSDLILVPPTIMPTDCTTPRPYHGAASARITLFLCEKHPYQKPRNTPNQRSCVPFTCDRRPPVLYLFLSLRTFAPCNSFAY